MSDRPAVRLEEEDASGLRRTLRQLASPQLARAIQVAATLRLADLIDPVPSSAKDLARVTGCDADALHRLMRYLCSAEVFCEVSPGRFGLTPMGRLLRSTDPATLLPQVSIADGADDRAVWWTVGEMLYSVRTGRPAYDHVFGHPFWEMVESRPEAATRFQQTMVDVSARNAESLLRLYDWSGVDVVADLGGGTGHVLARLLVANPWLRGVLLELPGAAEQAGGPLEELGVADRCEVVRGSFLDRITARADVYLLMRVLHNWPDEMAERILGHCLQSCRDRGRLLVVEMEVGPHDEASEASGSDISMLLFLGGRERSHAELVGLLEQVGFRASKRIELTRPYVAIEALPAHRA